MMHDQADEQEQMWAQGWRPAGHREPSDDEQRFLREHPGWLQAVWAHPDWPAWVAKRHGGTDTDIER